MVERRTLRLTFRLVLGCIFALLAQPAARPAFAQEISVPGESIRERALYALNNFEIWAYAYLPPEATGAVFKRVQCTPTHTPHSCYPGTLPPCIFCASLAPHPQETDRSGFLASEARMLAALDSAARADPRDELMLGMYIYSMVRRSRYDLALAMSQPPSCALPDGRCHLLRVFALQNARRLEVAQATLDSALAMVTPETRCELASTSPLLEEGERRKYDATHCSSRLQRDSVFWWMADPSFLIPGNDRRVEHYSRGVGNRILGLYRSRMESIRGIVWLARALPLGDSITYFSEARYSIMRPAGPWRWHFELSRFGFFDAMEVLGGDIVSARVADACGPDRQAQEMCVRQNRTRISTPSITVDCPRGYDMREMVVAGIGGDVKPLPPTGSGLASIFPSRFVMYMKWSPLRSLSCARAYSTVARYQFTPRYADTSDPFSAAPQAWQLHGDSAFAGGPPNREQYTPPYAPVVALSDVQFARFPRGDSLLFVAASRVPVDSVALSFRKAASEPWLAALIVSGSPDGSLDFVRRHAIGPLRGKYVFGRKAPSAPALVAVEVLSPDTVGFARARRGLRLDPWLVAPMPLSDLLLFNPNRAMLGGTAEIPRRLDSILAMVKTGTSVVRGDPVGVYWELGPASSTLDSVVFALTMERVDIPRPNLFQRIGALFGASSSNTVRTIKWTSLNSRGDTLNEGHAGTAVILDTSEVVPGLYNLSLAMTAGGVPATVSERTVTVVDVPGGS